jgi:hypothetical protein
MGVQPSADRQAQARYDLSYDRSAIDVDRGTGWLAFAGVLVGIAGILNIIGGIAAIDNANFYVGNHQYVFGDLNSWGWTVLVLGVAQVLVAWGIAARNQFARWTGVLVLSLSAMAQLLSISSYPLWSLALFTLDLLALYGLIAYGQKLTRA